jgi:N-acetylneuraminic acid mutarotase
MKSKYGRTFVSTLLAVIGLSGVFPVLAQDGTWTVNEPLPTTRASLAVGALNDVLYAVGGTISGCCNWTARMDAYDPASDSWISKAAMPTARDQLGVGVVNGFLFAVGGWNGSVDQVVNQAYDPVSNTWSTKAPMPTPRRALAVGVVNGILYAIGGGTAYVGNRTEVEAYDPSINTWTSRSPIPTPRSSLAIAVVNGIIYAIGGHDINGTPLNAVEAYDPASDSWSIKAPLPTARNYLAAAEVNGIIYAVGGRLSDNTVLDTVNAYDPTANTWSAVASMPTARAYLGAAALNGVLYAVGGGNQTDNLSVNEAFTPDIPVYDFAGFLAPIAGGDETGGSFENPLRTFKFGSTIPVKFTISNNDVPVVTGVHTLQAVKYSDATTFGAPLDATPQDAATTGNQFRFSEGEWRFNLNTRSTGLSVGIWKLIVTLSDGTQHTAWIQLK